MSQRFPISLVLVLLTLFFVPSSLVAQTTGLQMVFGPKGVETITYNGLRVVDTIRYPEDSYGVRHTKMINSSGQISNGWGETGVEKNFDVPNKKITYTYAWGTVTTQFSQVGSTINIKTTVVNFPSSNVSIGGLNLYYAKLHLPRLPVGFEDPSYFQVTYVSREPGVKMADYGSGSVTYVNEGVQSELVTGFTPAGPFNYNVVLGSTEIDGGATFSLNL